MARKIICPRCDGHGQLAASEDRCKPCKGTGLVNDPTVPDDDGRNPWTHEDGRDD